VNAGSLNTPAGSFDSCWTRLYGASNFEETFCQGVGPVDLHGFGQLTNYSIP
jgi:hypothetical protein